MNKLLSRVLMIGLYTSLAVIILGWLMLLAQGATADQVKALPPDELWVGLLRGDAVAILDTGLLLLMLTPAARVATALYGYAREGDRRFTLISAAVLLVLIVSFVVALLTGSVAA